MQTYLALAIPGGALGTGLLLVAMPIVLLMTIWTAYTMARILFPPEAANVGAVPRAVVPLRAPAGPIVPILGQVEEGPVSSQARTDPAGMGSRDLDMLLEDLWLRRN